MRTARENYVQSAFSSETRNGANQRILLFAYSEGCTAFMDNDTLQIAFNGQPVYLPGAVVSGYLLLHLNEPMQARSVKIAVDGRASTHWTETEITSTTTSSISTTVHYSGTVVYVAGQRFAWNAGSAEYLIDAGNHSVSFSFQLPALCPSSYEGTHGNIRYGLKATIARPRRFDTKLSASFQVLSAPGFTHLRSLNSPFMTKVSKRLGIPLFSPGWLSMKVTLLKRGFVTGEKLPIQIDVQNFSTSDVERLKKLKKYSHFIAYRNGKTLAVGQASRGGHTRSKKEIVATLAEDVLIEKESSGRLDGCLPIPCTAPTLDASLCSIIQITYKLKVTLWAQGSVGNKLKASLPITISTILPQKPEATSSAVTPDNL